jgi:hypothetical protein
VRGGAQASVDSASLADSYPRWRPAGSALPTGLRSASPCNRWAMSIAWRSSMLDAGTALWPPPCPAAASNRARSRSSQIEAAGARAEVVRPCPYSWPSRSPALR